jgi:RND family efflux transporter MFP subunit
MKYTNFYIIVLFWAITVLLNACNSPTTPENPALTQEISQEASQETSQETQETTADATLTPEQMQAVGIVLAGIENKQLTSTLKANGTLRVPNNNKANATSLYGGVVKNIGIAVGDFVKKGQTIATIAHPQFVQLQEEYLTIATKITLADQELLRQTELQQGNAGALKNLQQATAEANSLRTRRASLYKQIQLMGIDPNGISNANLQSNLKIISPIAGTISTVYAKIGSYVDVSSPLAEIVDNSSLHLDLNIFEKDLPMLKVGQTIHFTLTNNPTQEYDAKIFGIGSSIEAQSKTIAVHADVEGNKKGLIDGMNITAIVSLDNTTQPALPNDALVAADGKHYIFVTNSPIKQTTGNVSFARVEVLKGVSSMGYTAITPINALPANAKIAVKGAFFIQAKIVNVE